jgi:hypothetical protein
MSAFRGRVEDGRGGLGRPASPRFPSPLIERSVRISRTTLSDWLHRKAHDEVRVRSRMSGGCRLRLAAELLPTAPGNSGVCRLSPITMPSPSSEAHQKSGPFPPPALPGLSSTMTLSDTRQSRRPTTPLRPLPSPTVGLPQLPGSPFRHAVPTTPMDRNRCVCRLLPCSTWAFPVIQAGRRPSLHFRGLLRLHSRYGLPDCSTAQGGLCHEASTRPVARPSRSSATRVYRQLPGWILPPLVNRAVGAHVESRTGAVAWAVRHHPVSRPRSSNAACGFPALRSPTGFTAKHTTRSVFARE